MKLIYEFQVEVDEEVGEDYYKIEKKILDEMMEIIHDGLVHARGLETRLESWEGEK